MAWTLCDKCRGHARGLQSEPHKEDVLKRGTCWLCPLHPFLPFTTTAGMVQRAFSFWHREHTSTLISVHPLNKRKLCRFRLEAGSSPRSQGRSQRGQE